MNASGVYIYGAGGHGVVAMEAARAAQREILGFVDGNPALRGTSILGVSVCATSLADLVDLARDREAEVFLGIGSNSRRAQVVEALAGQVAFASIVHPSAHVSPSARIGQGSLLLPGAVLHSRAQIGQHSVLNTGAIVEHDCLLEDFVHVSVGARLGGGVSVGAGSLIGVGATVRNGASIGARSIVGVGAAVIADLPSGVVAWGIPATTQRPSTEEDSFS